MDKCQRTYCDVLSCKIYYLQNVLLIRTFVVCNCTNVLIFVIPGMEDLSNNHNYFVMSYYRQLVL